MTSDKSLLQLRLFQHDLVSKVINAMLIETEYFANRTTRNPKTSASSCSEISIGCNLMTETFHGDPRAGLVAFDPETSNESKSDRNENSDEVVYGACVEDLGFAGCDLLVPCPGTFDHGLLVPSRWIDL